VPQKKEQNPKNPQPAQHGAGWPTQEGNVTAQKFPQAESIVHLVINLFMAACLIPKTC
jgi:hypothetical protein